MGRTARTLDEHYLQVLGYELEPAITDKEEMYRLLLSGGFGNHMRAWYSLEELLADDYRGHISLRARETAHPVRIYHIPWPELEATIAAIPAPIRDAGLVFSESPPDECRTVQGEFSHNYQGYCLTYSFVQLPMRLAFDQECLHAWGYKALGVLKAHLQNSDYESLHELLGMYPNDVIEFSAFTRSVGVIPGRRMCVWEVRGY